MKRFYMTVLMAVLPILIISACPPTSATAQSDTSFQQAILLFTKTKGYRHTSIPSGVKAIQKLTAKNDILTTHSEDAAYFHPDSLSTFDGVVFLNTTGNILNERQQQAFEQFIQSGGGFMGIHAAADTEFNWPWYGSMIGAYFENHPNIQQATIKVVNRTHPATSFLPEHWIRTDEWYNYKKISDQIQVLMMLDESSYKGGTNGPQHPIAWYHSFRGGRIFYTGLGHTKESYRDSTFLAHLKGGLQYILTK